MSEDQTAVTRFTDQQVSAILKRAVQLQAEHASPEAGGAMTTGVSLAQLQQAAAELGIEPRLIEAAAAEVGGDSAGGKRASIWGGPSSVQLERTLDGTVTEEEWPVVLREIRRGSGRLGETTTVGKSFEWTSTSPDLVHVTFTPDHGQTSVQVMTRCGEWAALYYVMATIFAGIASLGLCASHGWPPLTDLAVTAGVFGGLNAAARSGFNAICRRRERVAHRLMRTLEGYFAKRDELAPPVTAPVQTTREATEPALQQPLGHTRGVV